MKYVKSLLCFFLLTAFVLPFYVSADSLSVLSSVNSQNILEKIDLTVSAPNLSPSPKTSPARTSMLYISLLPKKLPKIPLPKIQKPKLPSKVSLDLSGSIQAVLSANKNLQESILAGAGEKANSVLQVANNQLATSRQTSSIISKTTGDLLSKNKGLQDSVIENVGNIVSSVFNTTDMSMAHSEEVIATTAAIAKENAESLTGSLADKLLFKVQHPTAQSPKVEASRPVAESINKTEETAAIGLPQFLKNNTISQPSKTGLSSNPTSILTENDIRTLVNKLVRESATPPSGVVLANLTKDLNDLKGIVAILPRSTILVSTNSNAGYIPPAVSSGNITLNINSITTSTGGLSLSPSSGLVSISGNLGVGGTLAVNGITYTWPSSIGSSGQVLQNDGSGTLTWATVSGSGSGTQTKDDGAQNLASATKLNFANNSFSLVASGTTETIVNIDWTNGPASKGIAQTISGLWTFTRGASLSTSLEVGTSASISGNINFGGSGAHSIGVSTGSGALTINAFTLGGALTATNQDIVNAKHITIGTSNINNAFTLVDTNTGTTSTASFNLRANSLTTGTAASISATALTTGSAFTIKVASASSGATAFKVINNNLGNANTVASLSARGNFEIAGYASASRFIQNGATASNTFAGSLNTTLGVHATGNVTTAGLIFQTTNTGSNSFSGSLEVTKGIHATNGISVLTGDVTIAGGNKLNLSAGGTIQAATGTLTINAFTLGGAITGASQNITGLNLLTGTQASVSAAFEIGTYASISGNITFGGSGTHTIQTAAGSGALTINAFSLGGTLTATNQDISNAKHIAIGTSTINTLFSLVDANIGSTATASFNIRANSLTTGTAASISATGLTTGSAFSIRIASASVGATAFLIRNTNVGNPFTVASISSLGNFEIAGYASISGSVLSKRLSIGSIVNNSAFRLVDSAVGGSTSTASFSIRANSLTTGTVASISATSLTSGNIFSITATTSAFTGNVFKINAKNITTGGTIFNISVPASTSANNPHGILLVTSNTGATIASMSTGGSLALRGFIYARGSVATCTGTNTPSSGCIDYAEDMPTQDLSLSAGDLVSINKDQEGAEFGVVKSEKPYDSSLMGIVSTNPAIVIGESVRTGGAALIAKAGVVPIALAGRVPVKISYENGDIKKGDYITSSLQPGKGAKALRSGRVVGIALEDATELSGKQTVMVFLETGYIPEGIFVQNEASNLLGVTSQDNSLPPSP
ncbi:hypothetical protein KW791_02385, partial [Candidatus Parcubacteria bacterium]|nr:hypothetical protein [Candidatus Parcubacteria bacterium]